MGSQCHLVVGFPISLEPDDINASRSASQKGKSMKTPSLPPIPKIDLDFLYNVGGAVTFGDREPTVEVAFHRDGTNTCTLISRDGARHSRQGGEHVVFDALLEAQMKAIWGAMMNEVFALRRRVLELEAANATPTAGTN
jgi:hypothetical protein